MVARFFLKAVVLSHSMELHVDKMLPLCQRQLHLLPHTEYSHDESSQKPAKHCTLWATFLVFLTEDFAYTKHVPSRAWAGLSAGITALSCGERRCVQANAPVLAPGTSIPSALPGCLWAWWRWALGLTSGSSSLSTVQTGGLSLPWSLWQVSVPWKIDCEELMGGRNRTVGNHQDDRHFDGKTFELAE